MSKVDTKTLKRIGVYTSGGDAPGMNAALRAVVRTAIYKGLEVYGIYQGYSGMVKGQIKPLDLRSVANTIQRGGTMLKSGRCPEFLNPQVRAQAATQIKNFGINALACIGGDGSFHGAHALWTEHNIPTVGIPATIDNDIFGTEMTIGFDTAVNTALDAIDRIRDTADSHDRLFIVEVMGRDSGFIAMEVGLAGGAEAVFIPEKPLRVENVLEKIKQGMGRGRSSSILVTAEGQKPGRAYDLAEAIRKKAGFDAKVCILGHIQRGGAPTAADRNLASRFGALAINGLLQGNADIMVGHQAGKFVFVELALCMGKRRQAQFDCLDLVEILAQ